MNIGIIGKLGSGKTSAANYIVDNYGYVRLSLADPIRHIMLEYLDIKDKTDPRYRRVAQMIGTAWFRSVDDKVWVKYLVKRAMRLKNKNIVCDDCRFVNEVETLLNNNWIFLYLDCPLEIRKARCISRDGTFDDSTVNHPSETGVDDIMKIFGDSPNIITIDARASMDEVHSNIKSALAERGIYPRPEWLVKLKKGEWKDWLSRIGKKGLNFMNPKSNQSGFSL